MKTVTKNGNISAALNYLNVGRSVDSSLLEKAFEELLIGKQVVARDTQLGALLSGIMTKSPTVEEVESLIRVVLKIDSFQRYELDWNEEIICVAGSGKKGVKTINISTPASIVAASAGAFVVKPGSHATSSLTGSSDLMVGLGVRINNVDRTLGILKKTGLGYFSIEGLVPRFDKVYGKKMFVPNPLSFGLPALLCPVKYTSLFYGLSHHNLQLAADVLQKFGVENLLVTTCTDNNIQYVDEFGLFNYNYYLEVGQGQANVKRWFPLKHLGFDQYSLEDIKSLENKMDNIASVLDVLKGKGQEAHRDVVAINAAVILYMSKITKSISEGYELALNQIKNRDSFRKLVEIVKVSGGNENIL